MDHVRRIAMSAVPEWMDYDLVWKGVLFPRIVDEERIRELRAADEFTTLRTSVPAFVFGIFLCVLRVVLSAAVLRPAAVYFMQLGPPAPRPKHEKLDRDTEFQALAAGIGRKIKGTANRAKHKLETAQGLERVAKRHQLKLSEVQTHFAKCGAGVQRRRDIEKFVEAAWRTLLYSVVFAFGVYVVYDEDWILTPRLYWEQWPYLGIPADVWCYYMTGLGLYVHQLMFQFTDVNDRTDFWEMFTHHVATILLIFTSYLTNWTRVGCAIMLLHDFSDIFLESAKLVKYCSGAYPICQRLADVLFVAFAVAFFGTRLVIYPVYVLYSTVNDAGELFGTDFYSYWYFNVLLLILQGLHVFWFYLILRVAFGMAKEGQVGDDVREEEDTLSDEVSKQS